MSTLTDPNGVTHLATPLCVLGREHGTDKGGWHLRAGDTCHNYLPTYYKLLKDYRMRQPMHVLEIGIGNGASLRMWRDYFPHSSVFGLDNDLSRCMIQEERISTLHADQSDVNALDKIFNDLRRVWDEPTGPFDLIVDDGSHVTEHQIFTANYLQTFLTETGIYVIEDIYEDCRPESVLAHITWGTWTALPVGKGLGRAHCECGKCDAGEVLLVGRNNG